MNNGRILINSSLADLQKQNKGFNLEDIYFKLTEKGE